MLLVGLLYAGPAAGVLWTIAAGADPPAWAHTLWTTFLPTSSDERLWYTIADRVRYAATALSAAALIARNRRPARYVA
jgi:hypothetical protein